MMCNALVCLAVWLSFSARTTTDRILAIVPPIAAFVAAGFEHSVANMYFIPEAIAIRDSRPRASGRAIDRVPADFPNLTIEGFVANLIPVTIGNVIGGAVMVGVVYWFVYLRGLDRAPVAGSEPQRPKPSLAGRPPTPGLPDPRRM